MACAGRLVVGIGEWIASARTIADVATAPGSKE